MKRLAVVAAASVAELDVAEADIGRHDRVEQDGAAVDDAAAGRGQISYLMSVQPWNAAISPATMSLNLLTRTAVAQRCRE